MEKNIISILLTICLIYSCNCLVENENEEYKQRPEEFRAVWASPWGGDEDLVNFFSKDDFIEKMTYILDILKGYNMNAIIYHVRTHNDALYESKLNPISPYFANVNFTEFDPLEWMINESHKRGIEFHAWMNPYRIRSNHTMSIEEIVEKYKNFDNPANNKSYILDGTDMIIMNPGLEVVRNFIADTINEFLEKYDVDAIHFDDYFYCNMGANGKTDGDKTIIDEPDQNTYEEYINNHPDCKYNVSDAKDKADWRREQVDLLIILLDEKIKLFNQKNNKNVQFGISPTGIYKNGDGNVEYDEEGNAITTGSNTKGGQEHYASYLFCDTLKWVNKGWISYILPQSYWAFSHPRAGYKEIMEWWDKVVKYKKINLYSGLGLYMADLTSETYGWKNNSKELYNQFTYQSLSENIDGVSIYNFHTLRSLVDKKDTFSAEQIKNGMVAWNNKVPLPEIKCIDKIKLDKPKNLKLENKVLSFKKVKDAKFYVIYRSENKINFKVEEIIDIIGDNNDIVTWNEKEEGEFYYGIKALSFSNTLGDGASISTSNSHYLILGKILICIIISLL